MDGNGLLGLAVVIGAGIVVILFALAVHALDKRAERHRKGDGGEP